MKGYIKLTQLCSKRYENKRAYSRSFIAQPPDLHYLIICLIKICIVANYSYIWSTNLVNQFLHAKYETLFFDFFRSNLPSGRLVLLYWKRR